MESYCKLQCGMIFSILVIEKKSHGFHFGNEIQVTASTRPCSWDDTVVPLMIRVHGHVQVIGMAVYAHRLVCLFGTAV